MLIERKGHCWPSSLKVSTNSSIFWLLGDRNKRFSYRQYLLHFEGKNTYDKYCCYHLKKKKDISTISQNEILVKTIKTKTVEFSFLFEP